MKARAQQQCHGLTLVEALLVVATLALLVLVLVPRFARPRTCNHRPNCTSYLKQVGVGFRMYANDHNDKFSFAVPTAEGGSKEFVHTPDVFRHFEVMSNELVDPRILVCPLDPNAQRAANFMGSFNSNTQLSYFIGLDAEEKNPERLLSGDRNITGGTLSNGFLRLLQPTTKAGWSQAIHKNAGNIALADGSVMQTDAAVLRRQLATNSTLSVIRLAIP